MSLYEKYGKPNPSEISMKPTGKGQSLAYVGHAEVTRILGEIDDSWTWEPAGWDNGRPAIHLHPYEIARRDGDPIKGITATMWGHLTLLGVTRLAVGSVESSKQELDKELVSDFLRNAAMRFGICLALWMKDYDPNVSSLDEARARKTQAEHPATLPARASQSVPSVVSSSGHPLATQPQINAIKAISRALGKVPPSGLDEISKGTANILIQQLKEEQQAQEQE
jgi:hypothetical protein